MDKICIVCKRSKPPSEFPLNNRICFPCHKMREDTPADIKIKQVTETVIVREGNLSELNRIGNSSYGRFDPDLISLSDGGYRKVRHRIEGEIE